MDAIKRKELEATLESAFNHAESHGISSPIDLAQLGSIIKMVHVNFSFSDYGYDKLRPLLEDMPDFVEVEKDDTVYPPRYFANYRNKASKNLAVPQKTHSTQAKKSTTPDVTLNNLIPEPLKFEKSVRASKEKLKELAKLALTENWHDKEDRDDYSLLRAYIQYTYARLAYEDKVKLAETDTGSVVAFNTGLVDKRYEPIYALLQKNSNKTDPLPWVLAGFCCVGEDFYGKLLNNYFNPLPEAAYYFESPPSDAVYDINAGDLKCDWEHIIAENSDRIPSGLLSRWVTGFDVKSCEGMNKGEREQYKKSFAAYLENEPFCYRSLIDAFKRAVSLALMKVRWNYKTAVPVYYPTENKVSLLLPLSLLSDNQVDLALVVEKMDSGNYQGHTIYPLDWAYSNARLIARPESSWLHE